MANRPIRPAWRELCLHLLLGTVGGLIAAITAVLLFKGLYAVSFAVANQLEDWVAFGIFVVFLILIAALSGLLGGLAGSVVSGAIARQLWQPSQRWLMLWALTWMIGGLGLWLSIIQSRGADPALGFEHSGWWVLLGMSIALGFAALAPPWSSVPPRK
jgi:hypothetical protein